MSSDHPYHLDVHQGPIPAFHRRRSSSTAEMMIEKGRVVGGFEALQTLMNEKQENDVKKDTEIVEKKDAASTSSRTVKFKD
jgi:predicted transcriptional regulator of viral defense system